MNHTTVVAMSGCTVASSVHSIIAAFTDGLDIFRKIRDKQRTKRSTKGRSREEMRLSSSMKMGSRDVGELYMRNHEVLGDRFARGDAIANATLTEILLTLNTGLVRIISSFLNQRKGSANPDCKSLTALSIASRVETLEALNQLYVRLAEASRDVSLCKTGSISDSKSTRLTPRGTVNVCDTSRRSKQNDKASSSSIARLPVGGSSQKQLVVVRPRSKRAPSSNSTSSTKPSLPKSSTNAKVPFSRSRKPRKRQNMGALVVSPIARSKPNNQSLKILEAQPQAPIQSLTLPEPLAVFPCQQVVNKEPFEPFAVRSVEHNRHMINRHSTYSFASDSTKLGEIPVRNWVKPFDFAKMESLTRSMEQIKVTNGENGDHKNAVNEASRKSKGRWAVFKGRPRGK